jgi:hypothetical protein
MKKSPKNPKSAPQKEDPTTKRNDELQEDELNKVTAGSISIRKSGGRTDNSGSGVVF